MRMFLRGTPLLVAAAGCCLWVSTALAQLPGGLNPGGSSRQAQAQVQQRTQATVQQRVQQQTQQRVQAQAQQQVQSQVNAQVAAAAQARLQSRIQADAARAVGIAQRAAQQAGREAASLRNRVPNGVRVDAEASASARGQARGQNNSARFGAESQAGLHLGASLPPGITEADVQVYDNIFGRFNPLRTTTEASGEGSDQASTAPQPNPSQPLANQGGQTAPGDQTEPGASGPGNNPDPDGPGNRFGVIAGGRPDFASRVVFAAQQRRAEISQLRDHALVSGDAALMVRADEMEQRLNAFADASARARSATDAPGERSPARTARLPQTQLEGASATAIGAETK